MKTIPILLLCAVAAFGQNDSTRIQLSNMAVSPTKAEEGKSAHLSFSLKNIGTSTLSEELSVYCQLLAVLSPDSIFDIDDKSINNFSYQLLAPQEVYTYDADMFIPSGTAPGKYYVLVMANLGNCLTGDEADNILIKVPLEIKAFSGLPCTRVIGNGILDCTSYNDNGSFNFITRQGNTFHSFTIDTFGVVSANPNPVLPESFRLVIEQNKVVKKDGSDHVIYTKALPPALLAAYNRIATVIEFDHGYVLTALKNAPFYPAPNAPNTANLGLTLIKTDSLFNQLASMEYSTTSEGGGNLYLLDDQHFAFGYGISFSGIGRGYLVVMDGDFNITWSSELIYSESSYAYGGVGSPYLRRTACGDYAFSGSRSVSYQPQYAFYQNSNYQAVYNGSGFQTVKRYSSSDGSGQSGSALSREFLGLGPNGGLLHAHVDVQQEYQSALLTKPLQVEHSVLDSLVFDKSLPPHQLYPFRELVQLGHKYYLLNQNWDGVITLTPVDCDNNQTLTVGLQETVAPKPTVSVYPNPGHAAFQVRGLQGECLLTLYNLMGQVVEQQQVFGIAAEDTVFLTGDIPPGTYWLHINQKSGASTVKLMVF